MCRSRVKAWCRRRRAKRFANEYGGMEMDELPPWPKPGSRPILRRSLHKTFSRPDPEGKGIHEQDLLALRHRVRTLETTHARLIEQVDEVIGRVNTLGATYDGVVIDINYCSKGHRLDSRSIGTYSVSVRVRGSFILYRTPVGDALLHQAGATATVQRAPRLPPPLPARTVTKTPLGKVEEELISLG